MTALLELPGVRSRVHPISVDNYHRLAALGLVDDTVELLRGLNYLIRPAERSATVFRQPSPEGYRQQFVVTESEQLRSTAWPEFAVDLRDLLPAPRPQ